MSPRDSQIAITLERFDGPFDLLLALVRRNQYPLDDLPLVAITAQFLAYVRAARDLEADLGGEFIETASWLVLLKSQSLLPAEPGDGPSPGEELQRALLDHATLTAATEFLRGREGESRPASAGALRGSGDDVLAGDDPPTVRDVLEATRQALETARLAASLQESKAESVTVEEQMAWIGAQLAALPPHTAVSTGKWFRAQANDEARATLLLALLEMVRNDAILLHQPGAWAAMVIKVPPLLSTNPPS